MTPLEELNRPRYVTPRNQKRATYGGHIAAVAAALGWPLLPWQQYVADVAGELDDDETFYYSTVVITVQRQAGKTTLDTAAAIQNALLGNRRRLWYTAQTGQHASAKWREMVDDYFMQSPIHGLAKPSYSNGAQALRFVNGSTFNPHPPTEDSLHSKQSDRNTIDEAWAFDSLQMQLLRGAIVPTTTTRRKLTGHRPQLWIMSTEGTQESAAFNTTLDDLRRHVPERTAFFDWGIPPDIAIPDAEDAAAVEEFLDACYRYHPGANRLFERDDLDSFLGELGLDEFARAYGNRRTGAISRVIPEADFRKAAAEDIRPASDAPLCFGAAVGKDGTDSTITVTFRLDDGRKLTEVIRHGYGSSWVIDGLRKLCRDHSAPVVIDSVGPSSDLYQQAVKDDDITLLDITLKQYAGACSSVYNGIVHKAEDGTKLPPVWLYLPHPALDDAADAAAKRSTGDAGWVWGRRASTGSISAIEAGTLSTMGVDNLPEVLGLQVF